MINHTNLHNGSTQSCVEDAEGIEGIQVIGMYTDPRWYSTFAQYSVCQIEANEP